MSQEEKEWIRAEIQAIRQLIKERDGRLQRKAEIRAIRMVIRALEEKERHQIEKREFSKGVSVVEVLCYPEEGEALEEEEYSAAEHMGAKEEEQILPLLEKQMVGQCIKSVAEDVDKPSDWDARKENGSFSENEVNKVAAEEKITYLQLMHVGIEMPRKDIEQGVTEKIGGVPMVNAIEGQKAVNESLNVLNVSE